MSARERIHFYFDPICPWAWLTSRWATRLEELGEVELEWRLFSLGVANLPEGQEPPDEPIGSSGPLLQLLAQARRVGGNEAVARLYTAMGQAAHVRQEELSDAAVLAQVLEEAGLPSGDLESLVDDRSLWELVLDDHRQAVSSGEAFGVPTLILDAGQGPGIFGPVITEVPGDEECRALLQHVLGITRMSNFFELKRDRSGHPAKTGAREL